MITNADVRKLSEADFYAWMSSLSDAEAAGLRYDWNFWARPDQLKPASDMTTWLALAGRGWGKTRVGAQTVIDEVRSGRARRIALIAETASDARDVMVEGESGILACSPPWFKPKYLPSKRRLTWPNGAVATTYNATEPDQLRGPQFDFAWGDELAKWQYGQEAYDNLQFGLRLGANPWQMFTTTPRPIPIVRDLLLDDIALGGDVHVTRGNTLDNAANLAPKFLTKIIKKYEGTRLGRQELHAELLDDTPGALWSRATCEAAYRRILPPMKRIVLAIDPSGTSGDDDGDDIGMVVAGLDEADKGWVIADITGQFGPGQWGALAAAAYHKYECDLIVGEKNFGGAMVEYVIRSIDPNLPYKAVNASRGKKLRAEPVAALYEQNRVFHNGNLAALEDQMCLMTRDGYVGRGSPDRLDAMVWAITELMLAPRDRDMVF